MKYYQWKLIKVDLHADNIVFMNISKLQHHYNAFSKFQCRHFNSSINFLSVVGYKLGTIGFVIGEAVGFNSRIPFEYSPKRKMFLIQVS